MKQLICLCKAPIMAGVAATVLADALDFAEADISNVYMDDPWWGIIDMTVLPESIAFSINSFTTDAGL